MEVYKIKIYPAAKQDLIDIIDYLNTLSADMALRYYDEPFPNAGALPATA